MKKYTYRKFAFVSTTNEMVSTKHVIFSSSLSAAIRELALQVTSVEIEPTTDWTYWTPNNPVIGENSCWDELRSIGSNIF